MKSESRSGSGHDDFAFLSYSRKNEEVVEDVMDRLEAIGYNCWRDQRILPSTIWSKALADHIASCGIMICFVTRAYLESKYCVRELQYADKMNRKTLLVFLEAVQLPPELDMFFGGNQFIEHTDISDTDGLVMKICTCEALQQCRAPEQPPQVEPAQAPEAAVPAEAKPVERKKPRRRGMRPKAVILCVVLALMAVLSPFLLPSGKIELYEDLTVDVSKVTLILRDREITDETMKSLQKMEELEILNFQNCSFRITDGSDCALPASLRTLGISDCSGLTDLGFIEDLPRLTTLKLENSAINDVMLEFTLPVSLTEIDLSGNKDIVNLSMLKGCTELKKLDISDTGVVSLVDIPGEKLEWIDISRTKINSLTSMEKWYGLMTVIGNDLELDGIRPLSQLEKLTALEFSGCGLDSIPGSFLSLRLKKLDLSDNALKDLNAFEYCTILENVDISGNQIEDISVLHKSAATLKVLGLSENPLTEGDVSELLELCEGIEKLALDGMEIGESLSFLEDKQELTYFSASDSSIKYIAGLSGMEKLEYVDLSGTAVTNFTGLKIGGEQRPSVVMNLNDRNQGDFKQIPGVYYRTLSICCPEVYSINLPDSISGEILLVSANVNLEYLKLISGHFWTIYIVDCPYDQRVEIEDSIGISKVEFITRDEVEGILAERNIPRALNE